MDHPDVGETNYLGLTQADYTAVKPSEMSSYESMEYILKEYKSFDCVCCGSHFGYQHRKDPNIKICNSRCLSVVDLKLRKQGGVRPKSFDFPLSPSPVIASHIGSIGPAPCSVSMPIVTSTPRAQTEPQGQEAVSPRPQFNGSGSYGAPVPSFSSGSGRGGFANGSERGGRGGGFSSRGGGVPRGGTRYGGFDRSSQVQETSHGGWQQPQQRSTDEIDAKLAPGSSGYIDGSDTSFARIPTRGKENDIPSSDSAFKSLQIERKEDVIRAAREGARLTKPGVRNPSNDSSPVPKPLSTLTKNYSAESEPEVPKRPILNRSADIIAPPAMAASKAERPTMSIPSPTPMVAKKPEPPVSAPSPVPTPAVAKKLEPPVTPAPAPVKAPTPKPVKKIWKADDIIPSLSLVNQAACTVAFMWEATKFTLNTTKDAPKLEKLQEDIADYCASAPPISRVPAVGDILFAPYKDPSDYYRSRVDKVDETKGEVRLVFIDFGDRETVAIKNCREPDDKIMKENPMYGMILNLKTNVPVPPNIVLNDQIQKIVEDGTLYLQTDLQSGPSHEWVGSLFIDEEGRTTLNSIIEEYIIATNPSLAVKPAEVKVQPKPTPPVQEAKKPEPAAAGPSPTPAAAAASVTPKPSRPSSVNPFAVGNRPVPQIRKTIHNTPLSGNLTNGAMVNVQFIWNDCMVTISSTDDTVELDNLAALIEKHVETAPGMARKPELNEIVIAEYQGFYYRGKVKAVEGDKVKVSFVDWGDATEVNYTDLKELSPEIAKLPIYGIVLRLDGVPDTTSTTQNNAEIEAAMNNPAQAEIIESGLEEVKGRLWVSNDRTWNDIILDVLKAAGK